jgi:hypothetical protein
MTRSSVPQDPAKLLDAALDVFVYAPIGLLFEARDVVPKLAERGRGQVALARLFGRYAWQRGQVEADRILKANRPAADRAPASTPTEPPSAPAPTAEAPPSDAAPSDAAPGEAVPTADAPLAEARPPKRAARPRTSTAGSDASLPIPGYDSLSASQVVPRLDALLSDELEAVRQYESAHRGRRTILNRIAQLQQG